MIFLPFYRFPKNWDTQTPVQDFGIIQKLKQVKVFSIHLPRRIVVAIIYRLARIILYYYNNCSTKTYKWLTFKEGAKAFGKYHKIQDSFQVQGRMPSIRNPKTLDLDCSIDVRHKEPLTVPDSYLAEFSCARVIGRTSAIVVNNTILYDELIKNDPRRYHPKYPGILRATNTTIRLQIPGKQSHYIPRAINLMKDYSLNYYHFLIEILPRLKLLYNLDPQIPLLVDPIPPQMMDALDRCNTQRRSLIICNPLDSYYVEKLYHPSFLSHTYEYSFQQCNPKEDYVINPRSVLFVRHTVLSSLNIPLNSQGHRKIYITREEHSQRKPLNQEALQKILLERGFEICNPTNLSFSEQVSLFSQAKVIIAPTGAACTNLIFAPQNSSILIMTNNLTKNFHLFDSLARAIGVNLQFLIGQHKPGNRFYPFRWGYYIKTSDLLEYLENISD
jgi:hypothetical protein